MTQLNLLREKLTRKSLNEKDQSHIKGGGGKAKAGGNLFNYSTTSYSNNVKPPAGGGGLPPRLDTFSAE